MKLIAGLTLSVALAVGGCTTSMDKANAENNLSHAHMGHVTTAWSDTPDGKGFLPVAIAEAKTAAQHAGFAASKPNDLAWMQTHTKHVLHAVDPSVEPKGPGLGYGVIKAAAGAAKHINAAAMSDGASQNVAAHSVHVATASQNTVDRAKQIVVLGAQLMAATSAAEAAPLVEQIKQLSDALLAGVDANGDGTISWQQGEGGLSEAQKHIGFMVKGEGL
ncbi:MAG: hypothetical protein V7752_03855 [Halopseudomonas sp.]